MIYSLFHPLGFLLQNSSKLSFWSEDFVKFFFPILLIIVMHILKSKIKQSLKNPKFFPKIQKTFPFAISPLHPIIFPTTATSIQQVNEILCIPLQQQMSIIEYLTLSIKYEFIDPIQKTYLIRIHNEDRDISMQIENNFNNGFEYVYKMWPCRAGTKNKIKIQLFEKIIKDKQQISRLKGSASVRMAYTYQGQLYKFHGGAKYQAILMKFMVEKMEEQQSQQHAQLKRINKEIQQDLQKYKEEVSSYQEFLFYTNNVLKELNNDSAVIAQKQMERSQRNKQFERKQSINIKPKSFQGRLQKQRQDKDVINNFRIEQKQQLSSIEPRKNESRKETSRKISSSLSIHPSSKQKTAKQSFQTSRISNVLTKYRYLEENHSIQKDKSIQQDSSEQESNPQQNRSKETPLSTKIRLKQPQKSQATQQSQRMKLVKSIRQRRQQYLIQRQKQVQSSLNEQRVCVQTPIRKLTSQLPEQRYKSLQQYQSKMSKLTSRQSKKVKDALTINKNDTTRQQTNQQKLISPKQSLVNVSRLKNVKPTAKLSLADKGLQTSLIKDNKIQEKMKNIKEEYIDSSINLERKKQIQKVQNEKKEDLKKSQVTPPKNIIRRKKVRKDRLNISTINESDSYQDIIKSNSKSQSKNTSQKSTSQISQLIISNIRSLFYTNFKNNTKKCIIEHNNKVYQTDFVQNDLKQTKWGDKILITQFTLKQDIIFQVYSLKINNLHLQGSALIDAGAIISSKQQDYKLYLYFDQMAVGCIRFDIRRQSSSQTKRYFESQPQIRRKENSHLPNLSKSTRINTQPENISRIESYPNSNSKGTDSPTINQNDAYQQDLSYNEMTSKIRNLKMLRHHRQK